MQCLHFVYDNIIMSTNMTTTPFLCPSHKAQDVRGVALAPDPAQGVVLAPDPAQGVVLAPDPAQVVVCLFVC